MASGMSVQEFRDILTGETERKERSDRLWANAHQARSKQLKREEELYIAEQRERVRKHKERLAKKEAKRRQIVCFCKAAYKTALSLTLCISPFVGALTYL